VRARYARIVRSALLTIVLAAAALKLLVWWLEPRMAFFPFRGVQETPASAGLVYSDLEIATSDGEALRAWWIEHPSARAEIVFWHGNGGNLSMWLGAIADFRNRGFSVLAADYRGYGASTGRPSEQGIYRDADAVTEYFDRRLRKPGTPVVFWGRSLGCAVASHAATRFKTDALVLESPFPDVASLFAGNLMMRALSLFSSYRFATADHLKQYSGPLLIIHGEVDSIIPYSAGKRVYERAPSTNKTFVTLPDVDHNDRHTSNVTYWTAVERFTSTLNPKNPNPENPKIP
jgi:uncharacterized protein